jgi:hypothetical protein
MTLISNTSLHVGTALSVEPFGDTGALHITPLYGDKPGKPFILDRAAAFELRRVIGQVQA